MFVIGIGLDLVELDGFKKLYGAPETDLKYIFADEEIAYAGKSEERLVRLAGRFAAKEAALKAMGCGLQDGIALAEVVVLHEDSGPPRLELRGGALEEAKRRRIDSWLISLTYMETAAGAVAVALSAEPK